MAAVPNFFTTGQPAEKAAAGMDRKVWDMLQRLPPDERVNTLRELGNETGRMTYGNAVSRGDIRDAIRTIISRPTLPESDFLARRGSLSQQSTELNYFPWLHRSAGPWPASPLPPAMQHLSPILQRMQDLSVKAKSVAEFPKDDPLWLKMMARTAQKQHVLAQPQPWGLQDAAMGHFDYPNHMGNFETVSKSLQERGWTQPHLPQILQQKYPGYSPTTTLWRGGDVNTTIQGKNIFGSPYPTAASYYTASRGTPMGVPKLDDPKRIQHLFELDRSQLPGPLHYTPELSVSEADPIKRLIAPRRSAGMSWHSPGGTLPDYETVSSSVPIPAIKNIYRVDFTNPEQLRAVRQQPPRWLGQDAAHPSVTGVQDFYAKTLAMRNSESGIPKVLEQIAHVLPRIPPVIESAPRLAMPERTPMIGRAGGMALGGALGVAGTLASALGAYGAYRGAQNSWNAATAAPAGGNIPATTGSGPLSHP